MRAQCCMHNTKLDIKQISPFVRVLKVGSFLKTTFKTQLWRVFWMSPFQFLGAWDVLNTGQVSTFQQGTLLFWHNCFLEALSWRYWMKQSAQLRRKSFSNVKLGEMDKPFAVCSGRPDTWANTAAQWSVISYGNQHQPGRFCQHTKENASN